MAASRVIAGAVLLAALVALVWAGIAGDGTAMRAWADDATAMTAGSATAATSNAGGSTSGNTESAANAANASSDASANDANVAQEGDDSEESSREEITFDEDLNAIKENQLPDSSFIYDTDIEDLAEADTYYDQQIVQVVGEAVGDIVTEGADSNYCWVVLWDDDSTVTLYMKRSDAELIDTLGSYSRKGTTLQVRGVFNLVCSEHDGASDLHVTNVTVTAKGGSVKQQANAVDFVPGIAMVVAGVVLLLLYRRLRERQR